MNTILELAQIEQIIQSVASKFTIDGTDLEDRLQIGRIAVWKLSEKYQITNDNVSEYKGLIWTVVKQALQNESKKAQAQKRIQLSKIPSLDASFSEDSDGNLHDVLESEQENPFESIQRNEDTRKLLKRLESKSLEDRKMKTKRAVIMLLVHILGINKREIPKKICYQTFVDNDLDRYLWVFFNNSPFRAINYTYPGEFLPYHMSRVTNGYWSGSKGRERAIQALQNALKESGCDQALYPKLVTDKFLTEFRLAVPWQKVFGWDRFAYLDAAFPGSYHPWEFSVTPKFYFDSPENIIKAVRWLVEKKLGYDMEKLSVCDIWRQQIAMKITKVTFSEHGLRKIIAIYKAPEKALRLAYPDKFLQWSFQRKSKWQGEAGKQLAAKATRWVIEDYLGLTQETVKVSCKFFSNNGLWGMLTAKSLGFNASPQKALLNAYHTTTSTAQQM